MKAAVVREVGSIDNVEVMDVPSPSAGPGQVVINVRAASINHLDIWVATRRGQISPGKPLILGADGAGTIAQVGPDVADYKVGDEVLINPGRWCGQCVACARDEHSECDSYGILGLSAEGTFAEQVVVSAEALALRPEHLSWMEAAALPLVHLTAWRMLISRARLQAGQTVLIHGIGGGAALAALQIARMHDATVIATSSSEEKLQRAKELGAAKLINYRQADVTEEVMKFTDQRGVDVAFDTVGAATLPANLAVLRKGGSMVICGVTSGAEAPIDLQQVYWKQLNLLGSTMGNAAEFSQMLKAVTEHRLIPVMDKLYPLSDVREALRRMDGAEQFGKITLEISTGE